MNTIHKIIILSLICFLVAPPRGNASFLHAPHNLKNGIKCVNCHEYSFSNWLGYTPNPSNIDDTIRNFVCLKCHQSGFNGAPIKRLHSSLSIGSRFPNWTTQCVDCHSPHFQAQLHHRGTDPDKLFLITGTIGGGITYDQTSDTTVIPYSNPVVNDPAWANPSSWSAKTGLNRGLIFIPDKDNPTETFEIISNISTIVTDNKRIVIAGKLGGSYGLLVGQKFGIIYGQMLKNIVRAAGVQYKVKFFNPNGGYTDTVNKPPTGICQVCHTKTTYWTVTNPASTHNPGKKCTECHRSSSGYSKGANHANLITAYTGAETCLSANCHATSRIGRDILNEVYGSVHFQLRTSNSNIDIPGGGSHGMYDRACGLPGTTAMANNYANTVTSPVNGSILHDGCGKCHIAYGLPGKYVNATTGQPDMTTFKADVDCLICHAATYGAEWPNDGSNPGRTERKVISLPDGSKAWAQDRSLKTAQSVGWPTTKSCGRCHNHGLGPYKRATPFDSANDVHAAKGIDCTDCHTVLNHKIARGNMVTDGMANELPLIEVSCTKCHSSTPHAGTNAANLNLHTANVTCEACHIPVLVGDSTRNIYRRSWAPFTLNPVTSQWETTPASTANEYPNFWDAYTQYMPAGSWPVIRWFDGRASMLAQSLAGYADRVTSGGKAKLYAFKPFISGMLFDAQWLNGQWVDPKNTNPVTGTRVASMKRFYEQNWAKFLQFGFVDASYTTASSYWTARPDMAQMLNEFPMMLQFDRGIFQAQAGQVVGSPVSGPQTVANYPGIVKAINSGMGRMAIDMGQAPQGSNPETVGAGLWSGSFFGMWVPVDKLPGSPFLNQIGSLITVSHAIKGKADPIISSPNFCYSCHLTRDEYFKGTAIGAKRLDFLKLGYADRDLNGRVDPLHDNNHANRISSYNGPETCLACHEISKKTGNNILADVFNSAHFQLRMASTLVDQPGGGLHGMYDRTSGLYGTTLMANYANVATSPIDGSKRDDGCGECHVAYGPPNKYADPNTGQPILAKLKAEVDCLICHAETYGAEWPNDGSNPDRTVRVVVTNAADGTKMYVQDRSLKTAQTVGEVPSAKTCGRCHNRAFSPNKRGTPFNAANDIHAAKGMQCVHCHQTIGHKIARGNMVSDIVANELPEVNLSCTNTSCHSATPHTGTRAVDLNLHTINVACESCHIPVLATATNNIFRRSWAPYTMNPVTQAWEPTPASTNNLYPGFWDAYNEYLPSESWPKIRWFDGRSTMMAQSVAGYANRASAGGKAKLFAFKPFINGMIFDADWLKGQWVDPGNTNPVTGTRVASMKQYYEKNWAKLLQFKFVDTIYPTATSYWNARPDMAQMLNDFPMALQFDRAVFLSEGGSIKGTPKMGAQTGANFPGIARAINIGMGNMAIDMGYALPGSNPEVVGINHWSGSFFGMWVPVDKIPGSLFQNEIMSLIQSSHSIKGKANPILADPNFCYSCHLTTNEYNGTVSAGAKRLEWQKLGYPDTDSNGRIDPLYD